MRRDRSFSFSMLIGVATSLHAAATLAGGSLLCGTAADDLVAARAGLMREWVVQIPFDSAGWTLEHVAIGDGLVVVTSRDGGVHAVSTGTGSGLPRPGSLLWSQRVGRPGGPGQPAGIGSEVVVVPRDLDIHAFNRADGRSVWKRSFGQPASGAFVPSGDWIFGPLDAGDVMRLPVNPSRLPPTLADRGARQPGRGIAAGESTSSPQGDPLRSLGLEAGGRVESSPAVYQGGSVWCTEDGLIAAVVPEDPNDPKSAWARMEFDLAAAPAGPLVVKGSTILAATTNGDLVRLDDVATDNVHDFSLTWHVVLPQMPEGGPLANGDTVVISLGDEGVMAFAADTGYERWRSCLAGRLVSLGGNRVWLVDRVGRLTSLDLATGMPSAWLCLGSFTMPITNMFDDRLILASPDGLVVSLAPRRLVSAVRGVEPVAAPAPQPAETAPGAAAESAEPL